MTRLVDVAKEAGVSVGVVSKVLSGTQTAISIPESTKNRIRKAAKSLDYVPDARARLLRAQSSPMVGVLVRGLAGTFRSELLHHLSRGMVEMGKEFLVSIHQGKMEMAKHAIYTFRTYRTSAVLVIGGDDIMTDELSQMLIDGRKQCGPAISVSFHQPQTGVPIIRLDIDGMIRKFAERSAAMDCQYLLAIGPTSHSRSPHLLERFAGIMGEYEGLAHDTLFVPGNDMEEFGQTVTTHVADHAGGRRMAILVTNDSEAVAIAHALRRQGFRIPEDVAIMGYGNQIVARLGTPTITTFDVLGTIPAMAAKVVSLLRMIEKGNDPQVGEYLFQPEIIERESFPQPSV
jgi:DNA-binding LacI/PurR family transcriptional regulator